MVKKTKKTPDDYADETGPVYFEIHNASKHLAFGILKKMDQVPQDTFKEVDHGFEVVIHNQQIPEIVRSFSNENIAIYQVIRLDTSD